MEYIVVTTSRHCMPYSHGQDTAFTPSSRRVRWLGTLNLLAAMRGNFSAVACILDVLDFSWPPSTPASSPAKTDRPMAGSLECLF
ncbi:hypothetical protein VTI28DRAFT_8779 [Corynascus sepedonium]